jgi:hypothetical protein
MRRVKLCRTETQQSVDAASSLRGLRAKRAQRGHLPSKRREIIQAEEVSGDETRDTNDGSCAGGRTGCGVDGDRRLVAALDLAGNAHRQHKHSDGCFRRRKNHRRAVRIAACGSRRSGCSALEPTNQHCLASFHERWGHLDDDARWEQGCWTRGSRDTRLSWVHLDTERETVPSRIWLRSHLHQPRRHLRSGRGQLQCHCLSRPLECEHPRACPDAFFPWRILGSL